MSLITLRIEDLKCENYTVGLHNNILTFQHLPYSKLYNGTLAGDIQIYGLTAKEVDDTAIDTTFTGSDIIYSLGLGTDNRFKVAFSQPNIVNKLDGLIKLQNLKITYPTGVLTDSGDSYILTIKSLQDDSILATKSTTLANLEILIKDLNDNSDIEVNGVLEFKLRKQYIVS